MKLTDEQVVSVEEQTQAQAVPENDKATVFLEKFFGDHTFYLDAGGLNIFEYSQNLEQGPDTLALVMIAEWVDEAKTSLNPVKPLVRPVIVHSSRPSKFAVTIPQNFEDLVWLFSSDNRNRGIIRQNFDEAAMLYRAVKSSSGPILEIGRRHGGSTVLLVAAAGGRPVTSVDIQPAHNAECQEFFKQVLRETPDLLTLLTRDSRIPIQDQKFGLLFVDGDHSYDGIKADVIAHWPSLNLLKGRPIAVFHDAIPNDGLDYEGLENHCEGVRILCQELIECNCARKIEQAGSSVWLEKLSELPSEWCQEPL